MVNIGLKKNNIREINKDKRARMKQAEVENKSRASAEIFLESEIYKSAGRIMLYMPLGNEVDTSDIIKAAFCDGKRLVFPVTDKKTGEITPYYADADTVFQKGAFSVLEPRGAEAALSEEIEAVLVPGIAFDRSGGRVGFGKGCYDRLLKGTSAVKIGVCYDFQICDEIPAEPHDVKMDFLLTENGMIECR